MNSILQQNTTITVKVRYVFSLRCVTDSSKNIVNFMLISTVFSKKLRVEMLSICSGATLSASSR